MSSTVGLQKHPLLIAAAGGLIAMAVTGGVDRWLSRYVSRRQKWRDRLVRKAPAHQMAGPYFAGKIMGRKLSRHERKRAQTLFSIVYGIGWGLIYAAVRRKLPAAARLGGTPFGIPFFLVCDGAMAPLLGVSPGLGRIPWQMNAKELANHLAWTATTELVHRTAGRV